MSLNALEPAGRIITTQFAGSGSRVGKHKIPRFIYHLTTKGSYESMLRDGFIKTNDGEYTTGVFGLELTNFFKRWRKCQALNMISLQKRLIRYISGYEKDIVILKIPTEKLQSDKLFIRSQNRMFSWAQKPRVQQLLEKNRFTEALHHGETPENIMHIKGQTPASKSKKFKQRKEALEYIYTENIPISDAEKIGEVNLEELKKTPGYDRKKYVRSVFMALLKGTPEVKGAEFLNC